MNKAQEVSEKVQKKYGGVLGQWGIHSVYNNISFVLGVLVSEDPTHRWDKGYWVRTSSVVHLGRDYVETSNTVYALEGEGTKLDYEGHFFSLNAT